MILTVDIGNSNIVIGGVEGDTIIFESRIRTDATKTSDEYCMDLKILLGLCVGHDTLAIKYMDAPCTVLAVKDRVTGHNPIQAIYMANGYYKKRFYGDK